MALQHCDIKPDNFVLSDTSTSERDSIKYSNLVLVDFGRAVDMEGFSAEYKDVRKVRLTGDASRSDMRCVAMRNGLPWSFDIDTYGILCSAHVLLFGGHMELIKKGDVEWKPAKRMKRYWKQDLWDDLFRSVLNLDEDSGSAIGSHARSLRSIRERIDSYLEEQKQSLLLLLERQVNLLPSCREKI
jgi:checkpoint serine/threonine-protein kinase